MKKIPFILLFIGLFSFAQEKNKKNFFEILWGEPVKTNVSFMPLAYHTRILENKDFFTIYYTSASYKSVELAVFKNSFSDWTMGLFYKREIPIGKRFSINYGAGILYGYKGKLGQVKGLPTKLKDFFFGGAINPALGGRINYRINKKFSATMLVVPLVNAFGVTYDFN